MTELAVWQMAAAALCEYACGWELGRNKTDPVYIDVTEHRDGPTEIARSHYSSCADLPWWMLYRLGLRTPWMNRAANGTYNIGMNIADLAACPVAHTAMTGFAPEPGDICEIWNLPSTADAHALVVLGPGSDEHHIRTANYGFGGMSGSTSPGCRIANSNWSPPPSSIIGTRHVQRLIKLADIIPLLTAQPDLTGARLTGEVIDALGAKWSET